MHGDSLLVAPCSPCYLRDSGSTARRSERAEKPEREGTKTGRDEDVGGSLWKKREKMKDENSGLDRLAGKLGRSKRPTHPFFKY